MILTDSNQSQLSFVTLEGGGSGGQYNLFIYAATPLLDHLTIRGSGGDALSIEYSDNISVTNSSFSDNAGYGLRNWTPYKIVTATLDFWGTPSGPYHPTLNPGGTGERVSDGVLFKPWNPAFILMPGDGRLSGATLTTNNNTTQAEHFGYDATGRLTSLSSSGYSTFTLAYAYGASGHLLARTPTQGNPPNSTYNYDVAGQLTQTAISSTTGLVLREGYGYDAAGNPIGVSSSRDGRSLTRTMCSIA